MAPFPYRWLRANVQHFAARFFNIHMYIQASFSKIMFLEKLEWAANKQKF